MPRWFLPAVLVVVLAFAAFAGIWTMTHNDDDDSPYGTNYLEQRLVIETDRDARGRLTGVSCVHSSGSSFRCVGTFEPNLVTIHEQFDGLPEYGGVPLTNQEAAQLRAANTERIIYDVTLDAETGKFVADPRS